MSEQVKRYPRGYFSRVYIGENVVNTIENGLEIIEVECDPVIEDLWQIGQNLRVNTDNWAYRKRVIAQCSRLFGNFHDWLRLQLLYNDYVYDLNLAFLLDTVKYIRTGDREMSVQTWMDLILEFPEARTGTSGQKRLAPFDLKESEEFDNFIGMWVSHRDGFVDMLCTARVLYGVPKQPLETRSVLKP